MINIHNNLLFEGLPFKKLSFEGNEFDGYLRMAGGYIPNLVELVNNDDRVYLKCYLNFASPEHISISVDDNNKVYIEDSDKGQKQIIQLDSSFKVDNIHTTFVDRAVIVIIDKKLL